MVRKELESIVGSIEQIEQVPRGYTHNERVLARLRDGGSVFAKRAVDEITAIWLQQEHRMYEALAGRPFMPRMIGWVDGARPILVLEDLSDSVWPPPWHRPQVDSMLATLRAVASTRVGIQLPRLTDGEEPDEGWHRVLTDPTEFLSTGLRDRPWLEHNGPLLREAAAEAPLSGSALLHLDVRSDNICIRGESALLFDWNLACFGNPQCDVAFWLPSLEVEEGPSPEEVMPDCPPELASYVAGFFASRAGQPEISHAPMVRTVQRRQLQTALPWAARVLGLDPPQ
jgi:aminoglycoside phosphotransferase (APT) family kinase protein